jgi:hypothetical protein
MQVPIYRLYDKNGYKLYRREEKKEKNRTPLPKYFITNDLDYYKEFRRFPSAKKEFNLLTSN